MFPTILFKTVARASLTLMNLTKSVHARRVRNYYEVLKLKPNCNSRDIKRAYIDLSKKYHPDRNNNVDSQLFLDVAEAYSILSKEDLRRDYDSSMFPKPKMKKDMYYGLNYSRRNQQQQNPMDDPSFYCNRDKSKDRYYQSQPYYGIKGLSRMSNSMILVACLLLMAVGVTVQVLAIRHSVTFSREELMFKSSLAAQHLEETRQNAEQNGNQLQLAILEEKFRVLE